MLNTVDIPFVSSVHGRERRSQRDIMKRDLQAAVKYGQKERGRPRKNGEPTWKYTFANIVYITDQSSTLEITSYAIELPVSEVVIEDRLTQQHMEAKRRIELNPGSITSHTVIVVDMSGSMNASDMGGHKTRSHGVYYNIAEEFISPRLHPIDVTGPGNLFSGKSTTYTDVLTVIEMRDSYTVVFQREPVSWLLYNKIVQLANLNGAKSHGNYFDSIELAFQMLTCPSLDAKCSLCLFFFSDGRPSDGFEVGGRINPHKANADSQQIFTTLSNLVAVNYNKDLLSLVLVSVVVTISV